jgi:hypothetical protein
MLMVDLIDLDWSSECLLSSGEYLYGAVGRLNGYLNKGNSKSSWFDGLRNVRDHRFRGRKCHDQRTVVR